MPEDPTTRSTHLVIAAEDPGEGEAAAMIAALTEELSRLYAAEVSGNFAPEDVRGPGSGFLVGRIDGRGVACGAYRPMGPGVAEIKRMYVVPGHRGRRLGRAILRALEDRARVDGYRTVRLETGTLQPAALRLYEAAGYYRIEPYGIYRDDPLSVCFEKCLDRATSMEEDDDDATPRAG